MNRVNNVRGNLRHEEWNVKSLRRNLRVISAIFYIHKNLQLSVMPYH